MLYILSAHGFIEGGIHTGKKASMQGGTEENRTAHSSEEFNLGFLPLARRYATIIIIRPARNKPTFERAMTEDLINWGLGLVI